MAATSQQMSQNVGGVGAQGDLEQRGVNRNRSPWLKILYKALRSFISVMPDAMDTQRAVSHMNLEYDDDALFAFSKAFITSKETELEIVYPNLQPILSLYDKKASDDRSHLDGWVPDLNRKELWVISDSVLSLYNEESTKTRRPFGVLWWKKFSCVEAFYYRGHLFGLRFW